MSFVSKKGEWGPRNSQLILLQILEAEIDV
jgi:hypothetical protein